MNDSWIKIYMDRRSMYGCLFSGNALQKGSSIKSHMIRWKRRNNLLVLEILSQCTSPCEISQPIGDDKACSKVYESRPNEFSVILDRKFEPETSFNEIVPSGFVRF
jgi:hypothetical protein